jgi:hypothetical protein
VFRDRSRLSVQVAHERGDDENKHTKIRNLTLNSNYFLRAPVSNHSRGKQAAAITCYFVLCMVIGNGSKNLAHAEFLLLNLTITI